MSILFGKRRRKRGLRTSNLRQAIGESLADRRMLAGDDMMPFSWARIRWDELRVGLEIHYSDSFNAAEEPTTVNQLGTAT